MRLVNLFFFINIKPPPYKKLASTQQLTQYTINTFLIQEKMAFYKILIYYFKFLINFFFSWVMRYDSFAFLIVKLITFLLILPLSKRLNTLS